MNIKMVSRFIENKKIYRAEQKLQKCNTGFFTTGKNIERFINIVTTEEESPQHITQFWN